jgi:hypothetical protein
MQYTMYTVVWMLTSNEALQHQLICASTFVTPCSIPTTQADVLNNALTGCAATVCPLPAVVLSCHMR